MQHLRPAQDQYRPVTYRNYSLFTILMADLSVKIFIYSDYFIPFYKYKAVKDILFADIAEFL